MAGKIEGLILDMDGVLWHDQNWIIDPDYVFNQIADSGIKFAFATNNATKTPDHYLDKFKSINVDLEPWQIITSGLAAASYLADKFPERAALHVVGEWGLVKVLEDNGFQVGAADPVAVVCGMDRYVTYEKIKDASMFIQQGAKFIGTNPDKSFPTPAGLAPGAGAILAAIEAASGVSPEIIGKPKPTMYQQLLPYLGTDTQTTLVVGDRLETDIAGGQSIGLQTALVLSGVSSQKDVDNWRPTPDMIFDDLTQLIQFITK